MSSIFWKKFNLCLSKLKCLPTITSSSPSPPDQDDDLSRPLSPTIIIKNFSSTYDLSSTTTATDDFLSSSDTDTTTDSSLPDFATVFASQRFFFSSPGRSNSIIESPDICRPPETSQPTPLDGGIAVDKYSPDPHTDFRRSMQEMIESRETEADSEYLHQLLLCYLTLNPKHTHKFIISAFADIFLTHFSSPEYSNIKQDRHRRQPTASR
ncbi:hypothetical protein HS088_TW14G01028 [Tripterygium wilfordii]|uniref:Transcription repressor n=1 Tax=Tripterygium wilfordii TaxID=458696 RepID=A0A7J7CRZ9_TRIWF|nr:transcription repressor OFP12-like [Tripterygium wilfordii]KAF5736873.1 hypothetical protein HS088_TW14G01028 [Tripterygium wilfordii]